MAVVRNPIRFSDHFKINEDDLIKYGCLNPTLNTDTKLFIDPLLLKESSEKEIKESVQVFNDHFEKVIKFLSKAKDKTDKDVAWRTAKSLLSFPEIKNTCLGYGGDSISGSGSGPFTTNEIMETAKQIIDLGIDDPDLFVAMAVFEKDVGPDRISDMTTNIIIGNLIQYTERVCTHFKVPTKPSKITLKNGKSYTGNLPLNPYASNIPLVLTPLDILRDLPIAKDWSEISVAASQNEALRTKVSEEIAKIWERKTLKDKDAVKRWVLQSKGDFETFLELIHGASPTSYDVGNDKMGQIVWARIAQVIADEEPYKINAPKNLDANGISKIAEEIINQFKFLIEERRLSEDLYHKGGRRPEKAAQMLFFAVAYAYCKANNLDITPEADTGNGPVDFKISIGFEGRVLIEIKLSDNPKLIKGYTKQLEKYTEAEETLHGHYVVINVGGLNKKDEELKNLHDDLVKQGRNPSKLHFINGLRKVSASRLN